MYGSDDVVKITVKQFGTNRYKSQYTRYMGVIPYLEKNITMQMAIIGRKKSKNTWLQNHVQPVTVQD